MSTHHYQSIKLIIYIFFLTISAASFAQTINNRDQPGISPWGAADQIGRLNQMSDSNNQALFPLIKTGKVYDLGVEYFIGMPSFTALGDPPTSFGLLTLRAVTK